MEIDKSLFGQRLKERISKYFWFRAMYFGSKESATQCQDHSDRARPIPSRCTAIPRLLTIPEKNYGMGMSKPRDLR